MKHLECVSATRVCVQSRRCTWALIVAAQSPHFQTICGCAGWRPVTRTLSRSRAIQLKCPHVQFWHYNEPTIPVNVTTFIVVLWPQHGPSEFQHIWLRGQCSKSLLSKIRHLIVSFVASFFPLFCPRSRHLLSRRASHFSQILFPPFSLGCLCCLR